MLLILFCTVCLVSAIEDLRPDERTVLHGVESLLGSLTDKVDKETTRDAAHSLVKSLRGEADLEALRSHIRLPAADQTGARKRLADILADDRLTGAFEAMKRDFPAQYAVLEGIHKASEHESSKPITPKESSNLIHQSDKPHRLSRPELLSASSSQPYASIAMFLAICIVL